MSRVVTDVWITFTNDNTMTCEYSDGIDMFTLEYDLNKYNNHGEVLADFILDAGLSNEYGIQYHYCI